jgi:hypothetical protein
LPDLHFSEQYFTFSQSLAHFLRHSNSRSQRWQTLGAKPFFTFAFIDGGPSKSICVEGGEVTFYLRGAFCVLRALMVNQMST